MFGIHYRIQYFSFSWDITLKASSHISEKMWAGILDKFGVDVYVSLAGLDNITLLSVFLGNFNVIADLLVADPKE